MILVAPLPAAPSSLSALVLALVAAQAIAGCKSTAEGTGPGTASAVQSATVSADRAGAAEAAAAPAPAATEAEAAPEAEPETIAAQHVLVAYRGAKNAPRGIRRSKAEARRLAEEILVKARAGTEFAKLAEEFSDDPGSRSNLGNLGKFPKDRMVPEFSGPAFKLREGAISDVVETPFGFHIIKRNQ